MPDFRRASSALAAALSEHYGVGPGDRAAYLGLNSPDLLVLLYACARLGAMLVPLNRRLAAPELAFIIGNAQPKVLAVEAQFSRELGAMTTVAPRMEVVGLDRQTADSVSLDTLIAQAPNRTAPSTGRFEDPVLLVYTSGTTGHPKGALLSRGRPSLERDGFHPYAWAFRERSRAHRLADVPCRWAQHPDHARPADRRERHLAPALCRARNSRGDQRAKAEPHRPGARDARRDARRRRFCRDRFSSLRAITTDSSFVPEALVETFAQRGVRLIQVYGATETGPISVYERLIGLAIDATRPAFRSDGEDAPSR